MDDNQFLNDYKKKLSGARPPAPGRPTANEKPASFLPQPVPETKAPGGNKRKTMILIVFLLVAAALLFILLSQRGIHVIDLSGWPLSDAQLWADDQGIRLQMMEEYNDDVPSGRIISQDPKPGEKLKKGDFLKVTVSLGSDPNVLLPLPDLLSMTLEEVEAWAQENHMTRVRITTEYHDEIEPSRVIRYEINDDTVVDKVRRSTPIYVVVSKGKEPIKKEQVSVPDFKDMDLVLCRQVAEENGLRLQIVEEYDDFLPAGTILGQSIAPEKKVDKGTEITLTVSKGKKILVPDFSGFTREQAMALASEKGIQIAVRERYTELDTGAFVSQSLLAGTIYEPSDVVELTYSLGHEIVLPCFVGQTRADIESWAKEYNEKGASIKISVTQTQNKASKGTLIYQDPQNRVIGIKKTVHIALSLGRMVFVPDLVAPEGSSYGQVFTREKACALCEPLNLIPVFVAEKNQNRLPGEIWQQSIAAGTEVYEGTLLTLKYNPAEVTLTVPDFRNLTKDEIVAAGFMKKLDISFMLSDEAKEGFAGKVYEQSVAAGTTVAAGTPITVWISPEPSETAPPVECSDLFGG